ncbi:MAG TPA: hypothetical protein PLX08_06585 [Bacteroidales bacterium]|jgi:myosin heavy subunit|nr:hypothetical protein [Bacteroidales bacterium]
MEDNNRNAILKTGAVILVLLLLGFVYALVRNNKNKQNLNSEKLVTERLMGEKTAMQSELDKLKSEIAGLKEQSSATSKLLTETETKLADAGKRMKSLSGQYARKTKADEEEFQKQKAAFEKEYAGLKSDYDNLMAQNGDLQKKLTSLEAQTSDLLEKLRINDTFDSDDFQTFGSRGKKDKIVVFARRVKKLNVNFEVPQNLSEAISFKIITPSGTTITPDDRALSWIFPPDTRGLTASLSPVTAEFEQSRRVTLSYTPKEKLIPGEYKIQIFSNNKNIGNCRIRLR